MNCLCCGKPLNDNETNGWHHSCAKAFFGTRNLPIIRLDDETLQALAQDSVKKGFVVPGVQEKIPLHLSKVDGETRLAIIDYPAGYILKPQSSAYKNLPEMEQLVMLMANVSGIKTVPHCLFESESGVCYITKRIDRIVVDGVTHKLAMEDFCQLDNRLTADKYKGSYERCAKIISKYSSRVGVDMSEFYLRLLFSFVVGNSDMHLKNFSLIEDGYKSRSYILSPAYDLLPTNIVLPLDTDELALSLHGKKSHITKNDFLIFANSCFISKEVAKHLINKIISFKQTYISMCNESTLPDDSKKAFIKLIEERVRIIAK